MDLDGTRDVGVLALNARLEEGCVEEDEEERGEDDPEEGAEWSVFASNHVVSMEICTEQGREKRGTME